MTKKSIILVDDQQHATILAALRYYQAQSLGDPANRPLDIHDIATNGDTVISLDDEGINALCKQLRTEPEHTEVLVSMKDNGLEFGKCIAVFAAPHNDPYVTAARDLVDGEEDVEIDEFTVISDGDDGGVWVLSWLWVSDEEAGILPPAELLETVLDHARKALDDGKHGISTEAMKKLRNNQADWLEDLITNYADELDGIESEVPKGLPGPISWADGDEEPVSFMPSDALNQLRQLARLGGLPDNLANQAEQFCVRYGNKLDAILSWIYVKPSLVEKIDAKSDPEPKMATEDEIADYLAMQLADGHISPSDLAARMAKYGMRDPREFAIEMRERIDELRAA